MTADYVLTAEEGMSLFDSPQLIKYGRELWDAGNGVLVDDPFGGNRGTVLEVKHFKDQWGNGKSDIVPDKPSGLVVPDMGGGTISSWSEMYMAYDIAFPENFIFPMSVHLGSMKSLTALSNNDGYVRSGVAAANPGTAYRAFVGTFQLNGILNTRLPPGADHSVGTYYYNAEEVQRIKYWTDNPTLAPSGVTANAKYAKFIRGQWHRVELRMKLNTIDNPTTNDGLMQAWLDGVLVADVQNFYWRKGSMINDPMIRARFAFWYGGNSQKFAAAQDQSIFIDRPTLSANPITH